MIDAPLQGYNTGVCHTNIFTLVHCTRLRRTLTITTGTKRTFTKDVHLSDEGGYVGGSGVMCVYGVCGGGGVMCVYGVCGGGAG